MKKSIFLVFALMAMFAVGASAQIKYGAKLGLNLAKIVGDDFDDADSRTGLVLGGFINMSLSDKFQFQPELLYSAQGAKESMDMEGTTVDATYKMNYISLPLMFRYNVVSGLSIQAGPQIAFMVADKYKIEADGESVDGDLSDDMEVDLNGIDFGLNVGLGYKLENGFGIDARYNIGMSQIVNEDEADSKNSVIQIALSYTF